MNEEEGVKTDFEQEHIEVEYGNTACEHYLVESKDQDKYSELLQVQCTKCPHGASINEKEFKVIDGKICKI